MSDYKVDSIQVGNISNAISVNIDSELIFRDVNLPQGVTLSNLVSDVSYAAQIQSNVDAYLSTAVEVAIENITLGVENIGFDNYTLIADISGQMYDGTYENYLVENSSISDNFVSLNQVNNFNDNVGINKVTPETQLHIKNKQGIDTITSITLDNIFPDNVGDEFTTYTEYQSEIQQISRTLQLLNKTNEGNIRLLVNNDNLLISTYEGGLDIRDIEIIASSTLTLSDSTISGGTQVFTTTGGNAVVTSTNGFTYLKEGAKITIGNDVRYVNKIISDSEIEVVSISGSMYDSVNASSGKDFSFDNPLLDSKDLVITVDDFFGMGTKTPKSRLHIKDSNSIFLEDYNPNIFLGNKEDTFAKISYNFTSDAESNEGFSLNLNSSKLDYGATIKISSVSDDARMNSSASGEIQFYTSPYTYEDSVEEELRMSINTYGNIGINTNNPLSKHHIVEEGTYLTGTIQISSGSTIVKGSSINDQDVHETEFTKQVGVGDKITLFGETRTVVQVQDDYNLVCDIPFDNSAQNLTGELFPSIVRLDNANGNVFKVDYDGNVVTQGITCMEVNSIGDVISNNNIVATGNISGAIITGSYIEGDGSRLTNINIKGNENITTSGTISGSNIVATGVISGAYIEGDGSRLTNLPGVKKYKTMIGDNVNNPISITHTLDSEDISVTVKNNATKSLIMTEVIIQDNDTIIILFDDVPTMNEYTVTIIG